MRKSLLLIGALCLCNFGADCVLANGWTYGIGFNTGVSRLEGDLRSPKISPLLSGHVRALPTPYFAISGELGYAPLGSKNHPNPLFTDFKTIVIPFEVSAIFNFLPFRKINPYLSVGGGGVYWNATNGGSTIVANGQSQDRIDSFLKTGAGLEFRVARNLGLNIGATYRFSFTDALDQLYFGDENDQLVDIHAGFTFYFRSNNDKDHDSIPDDLDLMPEIAEDRDGYLDHDGIPERNPQLIAMSGGGPISDGDSEKTSPMVIHQLITEAEPGKHMVVKARVFAQIDLKVVATLYRPQGTVNWNVAIMDKMGENLYQGEIPGSSVLSPGLEYCVVAVDQTLSGIGYSGLPSKPIRVDVATSGKGWRILGSSVGVATLGTASYLILRKQN